MAMPRHIDCPAATMEAIRLRPGFGNKTTQPDVVDIARHARWRTVYIRRIDIDGHPVWVPVGRRCDECHTVEQS